MEHIFGELYAVPEKIKPHYFKVKVLELLLYLDALDLPESWEEKPHIYKSQVEKVKAIQAFLASHMDESHTQQALATRFAAMPIMVAAYMVGLLIEGQMERKWVGLSLLVIGTLVLLRFLFSCLQAQF